MPVPTPGYRYYCNYGIEPVNENAEFGPGAFVTGENLVVTAWRTKNDNTNYPGPGLPLVLGDIVIPLSNSTNVPPSDVNYGVGAASAMRGRNSAQAVLVIDSDIIWGEDFDAIMCVLNPPAELKQLLANSVEYLGGDPLDILNFRFLKSQQAQFAWDSYTLACDAGLNSRAAIGFMLIGQYVNLSAVSLPDASYFPLLKTNGANGAAPEFFDATTEVGMQEYIAAVNRGDFYIPAVFGVDPAEPIGFKINWPDSPGRA